MTQTQKKTLIPKKFPGHCNGMEWKGKKSVEFKRYALLFLVMKRH